MSESSKKIIIDTKCLNTAQKKRFEKHSDKLMNVYQRALQGLKDINYMPYFPKVYVIAVLQRIISGRKYKWVWNNLGTDPWNTKHLALFPSLPFIERINDRYLTMSFIHEFVHLIQYLHSPKGNHKKLVEMSKLSYENYDKRTHEPLFDD